MDRDSKIMEKISDQLVNQFDLTDTKAEEIVNKYPEKIGAWVQEDASAEWIAGELMALEGFTDEDDDSEIDEDEDDNFKGDEVV